jgi:lysosomal Pro-X carboxypeptidase
MAIRYFIYDKFWKRDGAGKGVGPVFFYFGNEDNVELYVNHTGKHEVGDSFCDHSSPLGLMWESAPEFGALLIFAEHRFYGKSMPFTAGTKGCMYALTI